MDKIVHIISLLTLIISFILFPTKKEKANLLLRITIIILFILSNNILSALILKLVNISCDLYIYGIINFLISLVAVYKIKKENVIQKYELKVSDIVLIILLLAIIITFAYFQYGKDFNIKYETTDASTHFSAAMQFSKERRILINSNSDIGNYFGFSSLMIGAYVNEGIFFSLFENVLDEIDFYKLYILFDLFMLFLSVLVMYELVLQFITKSKQSWIAIFISILYLLAYPLNSVLMGSVYLTLTLIFISGVILLFKIEYKIHKIYFKILLFLLNLGIMHTYILFAIIVFIAEIIYLIINEKRKAFLIFLISILLPILTSYIYINNQLRGNIGLIKQEGPMYKNYYSNIIVYLPIVLYALYKNFKNKENNIESWIFIILIIELPILYILKENEIISNYYLMKFYYLLWISIMVITAKEIITLLEKHFKIGIIISIIMLILLIVSFIFIKFDYTEEELMQDVTKENLFTISEMLRMNFNIISNKSCILNQEELELLHETTEYLKNDKSDLNIIGGWGQINWIYAIYNFANVELNDGSVLIKLNDIENINYRHLLVFKRASIMHQASEKILNKYHYIYETIYGGILEKNEI